MNESNDLLKSNGMPSIETRQSISEEILLPLVSIIIVNFNYARFIGTAVESVMAQTYPNVECVIVDDGSTDESCTTIESLKKIYPDTRVVFRPENGGQLAGAKSGLAVSNGIFVTFLDADDFIHPDFAGAHVATHLALRSSVGFTCCDMMVLWQGRAVSMCDSNISRYLASSDRREAAARRLDDLGFAHDHIKLLPRLPDGSLFSVNASTTIWPWASCSALMFRRDAIDIFAGAACIGEFKYHLDGFFCRAINALSGSALINLPLATYRLHGNNPHFRRPPLQNTVSFNRPRERKGARMVVNGLMRHILIETAYFKEMFSNDFGYINFLKNVANFHPDGRGALRPLIWEHFATLQKSFRIHTIAALLLMTLIWTKA